MWNLRRKLCPRRRGVNFFFVSVVLVVVLIFLLHLKIFPTSENVAVEAAAERVHRKSAGQNQLKGENPSVKSEPEVAVILV